jgi:type VI secretion system (T6SS) baseplate-like injector VgrG
MPSIGNKFTVNAPQPTPAGGRYLGIYVGTVLSTADPEQHGRMMVSVPSIGLGPVWAPSCVSGGGRVAGRAVIGFEAGDANYPIVIGFLP